MITVIIPTLNEEKYIGKLLNCLTKQTFKDFEVIVVDGFSDDNTLKEVNKFNDLNLRVINSDKRNVSYQRNLGVSKAKFDRLLFLDADVVFEKDFLSKIKSSFGTVRMRPIDGKVYDKIFFGTINFLFFMLQSFKPYAIGSCIISNKQLHEKVNGFDNNITFCEDFDYVRRCSKFSRFNFDRHNELLVSIRRFEEKGTKKTMKLWMRSFFYNLFTNKFIRVDYD